MINPEQIGDIMHTLWVSLSIIALYFSYITWYQLPDYTFPLIFLF